jgi:hypothetical protein
MSKWLQVARSARASGSGSGPSYANAISADSANSPQNRPIGTVGTIGMGGERAAEWGAEDWQAHFDERAGIAEHDGGLSRAAAERQAFECCVVEWQWRNPPPTSGPERCPHCAEPLGEPGRDGLPYLTGDGGHVWLHSGCHGDWTGQRRAEAVAALAVLGLRLQAGKS